MHVSPPGTLSESYETAARFHADPRPHKLLLQLGTYLDDDGGCAGLPVVREARQRLAAVDRRPDYLPLAGDPTFRAAVTRWALDQPELPSLQVSGGTAALRLAAATLLRVHPGLTAWVPDPTWPNHLRILADAGVPTRRFAWPTRAQTGLDLDRVLSELSEARAGDVVIFHAACHNPTGIDPTDPQWRALFDDAAARGWVPLLDGAFLGYRDPVQDELAPARQLARDLPACVWLLSLGKSLRMYDARLSVLVFDGDRETARRLQGHAEHVARGLWSSPPAFDAQVAAAVLGDPDGRAQVERWLDTVRRRLRALRGDYTRTMTGLGVRRDLAHVQREAGLFTFTGLPPEAAPALAERHAIYLGASGGINLSALGGDRMSRFCEAAAPWLRG